jgi:hypothetical protein
VNTTILKNIGEVNQMYSLASLQFLLPDSGKSLPRLHKARIEAKASRLGMTLKPGFPLKPTQPNFIAVAPMKSL